MSYSGSQRYMAPWTPPPITFPLCGCWFISQSRSRQYLPQVDLNSTTTILAYTSRTRLVQTFTNPAGSDIPEAQYTFPLYDGVSVVSFQCTIGERVIRGVVKQRQQAQAEYREAVDRGEVAGLLEQSQEAGDVFTTKIGNIPASETVTVEIVYLGELKHDAETDGVRFTIPTAIAPRYGTTSVETQRDIDTSKQAVNERGIRIVVEIAVPEGSAIRAVQSPSHPIAVILGRNSTQDESLFKNNLASATLSLAGRAELDKDFIIVVNAQGQDTPRALLETHPTKEGQRALMSTLVPKFHLPNASPEIVFVVDRSGSMDGKIPLVVQALKVFLKSLPMSVKFNICSFGSGHSFLFPKSKPYDKSSLDEALQHLKGFAANYGGTQLLDPITHIVKQRLNGTPLEIMVLTDGEVWNQNELFSYINEAAQQEVRVFSLGIGSAASSSLVEGMARAGNGFAQFVHDGEQIDKRVVRMLKAALMPFVKDYSLEIVYGAGATIKEDDYEMVESSASSVKTAVEDVIQEDRGDNKAKKPISLFDSNFKEDDPSKAPTGRYDHLPDIPIPEVLQVPSRIPQLYPFNRTSIYLLLDSRSHQGQPQKVVLRGVSSQGPVELEIPIQNVGKGETIHQLAAKRAVLDLEEGRGWITGAKTPNGKLVSQECEGDWERIIEREAVRLGTTFQIAGKYCSFVAVEAHSGESEKILSTEPQPASYGQQQIPRFLTKRKGAAQVSHAFPPPSAPPAMTPPGALSSPGGPPALNTARRSPVSKSAISTFSSSLFGSARNKFANTAVFGSAKPAAPTNPGAFFGSAMAAMPPPPPPPALAAMPRRSEQLSDGTVRRRDSGDQLDQRLSQADEDEEDQADETELDPSESAMHCLIDLQEFDGRWKKSVKFLSSIEMGEPNFAALLPSVQSDDVKSTILAIAWLETKARQERDVWDMVSDKAREWLVGQGIDDTDSLIEAAKKAFVKGSA